ncbi:MAG: hypothetical protein ABSH22_05205 [Tepidisphaeraceae bacterium]
MRSRRFPRCGRALAALILASGFALVHFAQGQATTAPSSAADIELGKPSKYPILITPTVEGGVLRDDHHGQPLLVEEFEFNPVTHEISLAKDSPNQQRMYGNTRFDAAYYNSDINVFDLLTSDRAPIGKIVLVCANKKIVISPNYVVSPTADLTDDPPPIDPSTYCASVHFEKGPECNKPDTTVTFSRNDDPPAPVADTQISKINRKSDVIKWTVQRGGAVVQSGSFGFPVVATDASLVKYVINLP